jgi:uncharacterized membrane protein YobD (UPF0266 family)
MKSFWRSPFALLSICLLVCLLLLAYPIYVIRPFRHQGATELSLALQVMRVRPAVVIPLAFLATLFSFVAWKRISRLLPRIGVVLLAALTLISGALSFVNVYELMFKPLRRPTFKNVSETRLDGAEQVIAVKLNRSSRAYPIRVISYHHIVNDVLAGFPIVATY